MNDYINSDSYLKKLDDKYNDFLNYTMELEKIKKEMEIEKNILYDILDRTILDRKLQNTLSIKVNKYHEEKVYFSYKIDIQLTNLIEYVNIISLIGFDFKNNTYQKKYIITCYKKVNTENEQVIFYSLNHTIMYLANLFTSNKI